MEPNDYITQVFGPEGLLASKLVGYEARSGQVQMARTVDRCLCDRAHLLSEAGCGVGKSIAYGVPIIAHCACNDARAVIATANIALQEQIFLKDLPFLLSVLPWQPKIALLKGKNNYVCRERVIKSMSGGMFVAHRKKISGQALEAFQAWMLHTETGDRNEYPGELDDALWSLASTTTDGCRHPNCSYSKTGDCFFYRAKAVAMDANIVVTNQHMLFAHFVVEGTTEHATVLGPFKNLIIDEAHELGEVARKFLEFTISRRSVAPMVEWARKVGKKKAPSLLAAALQLDFAMKAFMEWLEWHAQGAVIEAAKVTGQRKVEWIPIQKPGLIMDAVHEGVHVGRVLLQTLQALREACQSAIAARMQDMMEDAREASRQIDTVVKHLNMCNGLEDTTRLYWIDVSGRDVRIKSCPYTVSRLVEKTVFSGKQIAILTSATLSTDKNFRFIRDELGVPGGTREIVVTSPFNFASQCKLVVPDDVPVPSAAGWSSRVAETVGDVIRLARGRTLVLFTSRENMLRTLKAVKAMKLGYEILVQDGTVSKRALYIKFKEDISSCLFALASFWTGIDVPGEALSALVIDKLPFPNMSDPVNWAIKERVKGSFINHFVPKATITLKQGFGRLIRHTTDRGVVVITDSRLLAPEHLTERGYARRILTSLPDTMTYTSIESARGFI